MSLTKVSFSMIQGAPLNILDFGADNTGIADITAALNAAIAAVAARTNQGGTIYFPAGVYRLNTAINITNTHGLRFLGDSPTYTPGFAGATTSIYFYGSGNAITLIGLIAAQSEFIFENIYLENKGNPGVGNGIAASSSGFCGGLEVIGSSILRFSSGVYTVTGSAFSYQKFKNSAFYFNSTWGVAAEGDGIFFQDCTFSNNGPSYLIGTNAFNLSPVGGAVLIETTSTTVSFIGGNTFEGHQVGIFIRGTFGVTITGCYFEAFSKASIQAINVTGLTIQGNYYNPNTESGTILLDNVSEVSVKGSGYVQNVWINGVVNPDFEGVNVHYLDTTANRSVENEQFIVRSNYNLPNIDINDQAVLYQTTPSGGALVNISGPTLQSEIGPFGAFVNRYIATASGFFYINSVTAVAGQYVYFSVLIRNATTVTAVVRDTSENNLIVSKTLVSYGKDWSVLTVGGKVPANQSYRLTLIIVNAETFDLGGIISYLNATPLANQIFSFANYRRTINQNQSPTTITTTPYTVLTNQSGIIANVAGTTTLSLPSAALYSGKQLNIRTIQAQSVISDASNVIPLIGGAAGTAILSATAGKWAMLQSDGTSWQIMSSN